MKLFVFEFICGGGLSCVPLDTGLTREGGAMLTAVVEDAVAAGFDVASTLDQRLNMKLPGARVSLISPGESASTTFDQLSREAGTALVIAPEFDGLLAGYADRLAQMGVRSLGCSAHAISLCGDKLKTAERLIECGVPSPWTKPGVHAAESQTVVTKPRWGAGCQDTFVLHAGQTTQGLPSRSDWITQQYMPGTAASAAFLVREGRIEPLRAGMQRVSGDHKLAYGGGRMPLRGDHARRAMSLGRRAVEAIDGLNGYVGVDLVLGDRESDDAVIEINPRITVAYAGVRRLCATNLVTAMCDTDVPIDWCGENVTVEYGSGGTVRECDA